MGLCDHSTLTQTSAFSELWVSDVSAAAYKFVANDFPFSIYAPVVSEIGSPEREL